MDKRQTTKICETNAKRAKRLELTLEKQTIRTLSGSELKLIAGGGQCVCTCNCNHTQVLTKAY